MGTSGGSRRLVDLAQELRLYKPQSRLHTESVTVENPIPNQSESSKKPRNRAAVLVCLFEGKEGELRVILTKRSSTMSSHSGEIHVLSWCLMKCSKETVMGFLSLWCRGSCLAWRETEDGDANDIQTALREAKEEIGLDPSLVDVVAILEPFVNKRGITIVTVIGILANQKAFHPVPNVAEVDAIFDAPLEMFLKDENRMAEVLESEGKVYLLHYFDYEAENNKYVIWALTAEILIRTASLVYQRPPAFSEQKPHFWSRNLQSRY